jgi:transcriptional regulator with XRE-family HTH domain
MAKNPPTDVIGAEQGRRIAAERTKRGWTQKQLAEQTGWSQGDDDSGTANGFSPSRIGNYEQGERRLGIEEARILARVFEGLHPAYFLCAVDERTARVLYAMELDFPTRAASGP